MQVVQWPVLSLHRCIHVQADIATRVHDVTPAVVESQGTSTAD